MHICSPQKEIKAIEKRMDDTVVVIQHLERHVMNAACEDPGSVLGTLLLLPVLQVWMWVVASFECFVIPLVVT